MRTIQKIAITVFLACAYIVLSESDAQAVRSCLNVEEECLYYFGCNSEVTELGCGEVGGVVVCQAYCPCGPSGPEICTE